MVLPIVRLAIQKCATTSIPVGARSIFGIKLPRYGPDPLDLATGIEKKELMAIATGNDDPFLIKPVKRGVGTRECPTKIPSVLNERMMGCVCNEDSLYVAYMTLNIGQPKRCECGHWFELYKAEGIDHPSWVGPH